MKLNFWQWLGVALLVLGAILLWKRESAPSAPSTPPATQGS